MGSSSSTSTGGGSVTREEQDIQLLGRHCPYSDAELWYLYDVYRSLYDTSVDNDSNSGSNSNGGSSSSPSPSFFLDWALTCWRRGQKDQQQLEPVESLQEQQRKRWTIVLERILPVNFERRFYRSNFLLPDDEVCLYYDADPNNDESITAAAKLAAFQATGRSNEGLRQRRLEAFFEGLSNSTRRGSKAAILTLFQSCKRDPSDVSVSARELIESGYRLALAVEYLRMAQTDDPSRDEYLAPEPAILQQDTTLQAFSRSIVEICHCRKRRLDPLFEPTGYSEKCADSDPENFGDDDGPSDQVEIQDILEWSDAVAPLFASILPAFFHRILFPNKTYRPTYTAFEFPRNDSTSSFFRQPNSSLLFTVGCWSSSLTGTFRRLYTSDSDGMSFNRLQNALLGYSGPTLIMIRAVSSPKPNIFGAFTSSPWKESKDFYGNSDCFLFQLAPRTALYRPTGNGTAFMYCNSHARSRGYDQQAHGIGFGGTVDQPRLFLSESSLEDNGIAASRDVTFEHGTLLAHSTSTRFTLECLEVWGVGGTEVVEHALSARSQARAQKAETIRKCRQVDKAQFLDDLRSGLIESKAFNHRQQVDGRADPDQQGKGKQTGMDR